jgi:hypothetical protein
MRFGSSLLSVALRLAISTWHAAPASADFRLRAVYIFGFALAVPDMFKHPRKLICNNKIANANQEIAVRVQSVHANTDGLCSLYFVTKAKSLITLIPPLRRWAGVSCVQYTGNFEG